MEATETHKDTIEEQQIKSLWTALQVAEGQREKRGLQFGQAVYEYREKHSGQGRRTDLVSSETRLETFEEFCDRLNIPRATAYRWIAKYEEFIGTRLSKPNPDNRPSETTSYEVKVEADPTAQATSMDVSPDENSSSAEDDLPPESKPEPTPPTRTPTAVVSYEKRDLEQLGSLAHRLDSVSLALKQVVDAIAKWSKYAEYTEYADVVSAGEKIADFVTTIRTFIPDNQNNFFDEGQDAK
jgi:hypothetical protein